MAEASAVQEEEVSLPGDEIDGRSGHGERRRTGHDVREPDDSGAVEP